MINFIVYDTDKNMRSKYNEVIHRFMGSKYFNYNIYEFDIYTEEIDHAFLNQIIGKKIYLLSSEILGMSGFEIAQEIRNNGDWVSQIIIITDYDNYSCIGYVSRLLMINFVLKSDIETELIISLNMALNILNKHASLTFKHNSEIFQLLYSDIYYIEKNLNDNSSTIVTKNKEYTIRYSINKLMSMLSDDPRFFKSHRSCIINLNNVKSFDINKNVVRFKNKVTNLVARDKKRELKDRLINKNILTKNH